MLSAIQKQHVRDLAAVKAECEVEKEEATKAAESLANAYGEALLSQSNEVNEVQNTLVKEVKQLEASAAQFVRQTTAWAKITGDLGKSLKELGDFQNWARTIEKDLRTMCGTVDDLIREEIASKQ
uniref:Biogenesis of lysosome-related organelles complex 1 subunit 1 n=1 Tax=Palpitomonas bilix TaxID=652834 RepID=A0A7S3D697_9EUKA|mmetsp:Transcript_23102/g.58569  ORF Transcript_23102/g.58569 Transcript_23102/m.58569 type:complete len:125 (+) Transcript_23102:161-535(+)